MHRCPVNDLFEDCFSLTLTKIKAHGIKLTRKQLACLCLWTVGKSAAEMAYLLDVAPSTIHYHQDQLRQLFDCASKAQLNDKIRHLSWESMFNECFNYLTLYQSEQVKDLLAYQDNVNA